MAEEGTSNAGDSSITFTDGESKIFLSIMKHLTSDIQFDADAVAAELGYKDGGIVKTRWSQIKRKKLASGTASPAGGIKKRAAKGITTPKKNKAGDAGMDEDDDEPADTPIKTPKGRGRKPKAKKAEDSEDAEVAVKEEEADFQAAMDDAE